MRRPVLFGFVLAAAACSGTSAPHQADDANDIAIAETERSQAESAARVAQRAAPEPATIPAKFRGFWAEGRAACAQPSHPSRLIISERVIRYPSLVLIGESVDLPTDAGFAVKGLDQLTGAPAEAHFSIDATGSVLTDEAGGGAVRVKCR